MCVGGGGVLDVDGLGEAQNEETKKRRGLTGVNGKKYSYVSCLRGG